MQLYEKIQFLRKHYRLTQADLADKLDVSRQAVQKWESGVTSPDLSKLPEIAKIFGITTDKLLDSNLAIEDLLEIESVAKQVAVLPNHIVDEEDLDGKEIIENQIENTKKVNRTTNDNRRRSMLDYMLMIPVAVAAFIGIVMFYFIGGIFLGMLYVFSLIGIASPFLGIALIVVNSGNGVGAIILCVGFMVIGFGSAYPLFIAGNWWRKKYLVYAKKLWIKIKNFDIRSVL